MSRRAAKLHGRPAHAGFGTVRRRGMFLIPELAIERWLFHDGLSVNDGRLVALAPAAEKATGIRDRLLEELAPSGLDPDRALDRALNEAAEAFRSQPP